MTDAIGDTTVDAVVIGAGPNGLVAANLLADAGWDVLVLEAEAVPGGAVRTGEAIQPGVPTDLFSAFYPMAAVSPVIRGLRLESYGLRWRRAPAPLAHVLPDDRCALLADDVDRTAAGLGAFAPADEGAWRAEFVEWQRMRRHLVDALFTPFPPVRPTLRLLRAVGFADLLRFSRLGVLPTRVFCDERFRGEGAKVLVAGNALHAGLGPEHAGGAMFGWLLCMIAQDVGFPVVEGGAGRLTDALVRRLAARDGRVACGREVARVLVHNGRATGVADVGGAVVRARHAVLATVSAPELYRRLVGAAALPPRLWQDLRRFHWDDATVKADWTLSGPVPWRNPDAALAGTVHLDADIAGLATYSADLAGGRLPDRPFLLLGQMTVADPTRTPAGTESVWAYTHVPRGLRWNADDVRLFADRMQASVERHAPGFTSRITGRVVRGPHDLARADHNLVEGAINAGSAAIHQQLFFRPLPGLGRADTPIDRLYLAGASAHPGGAVHGGPGANAARAALVRAGVGGELYRALIRRAFRLIDE